MTPYMFARDYGDAERLNSDGTGPLGVGERTGQQREEGDALEALQRELEHKVRWGLAAFVAYTLAMMGAYIFVLCDAVAWLSSATFATLFTVGILSFYALFVLVIVKYTGYPLSIYGLLMKGWRSTAVEATVWTAAFCVVVTLVKALVIGATGLSGPLFAWPLLHTTSLGATLLDGLLYSLFVPIQELVARGVLQGSLEQILSGRYARAQAIAFSTLIFALTHLHLSPVVTLLVILPSVFWGVLFARQGSLFGVSLSHVMIGLYVLYVLGMPGLRL